MDNAQLISTLQAVISPVVLMSGVGMLVLSMTNRFTHAADRVRQLVGQLDKLEGDARQRVEVQIRIIYHRLRTLLLAIVLGLGSVLLTGLLIVTLFSNYLIGTTFRRVIVVIFALSLLSLISSLIVFIRDMCSSLTALKEEVRDVL